MANNTSIYNNFKKLSWLLAIPLILGVLITSCGDDSPVSPQEQLENAKGTVQGVVVDKATGDPLSGVGVTLVYEDSTDEGSQTFSGSTSSDGSFTFRDVPVTKDAKTNEGNPYTLRLDASSLDNYRDSYLAKINVVFESTEGDNGAVATDMVSNIRIPLSEQAVTVTGKAHTFNDKVISGATVELYQVFNPVINGDNSTETDMLVATGETGDDGSFTFEGVEEDASVYFKFIDKSDPANVIDAESGQYTTPAGSEGNATLDLGVIKASEQNQSGAFYLTSVMPAPGSDIRTDTVFKFAFNRPVADNEYTRTDLGFGNGTIKDDIQFNDQGSKKAPGDVEFSVSFSSNRDTLIVNPDDGMLVDATEYELEMDDALDDEKFVDRFGNELTWGASDYEENKVDFFSFSTNNNNAKPHTPQLSVDGASSVDYNEGFVELSWEVDESPADVKEYEFWEKKGDESAYELLAVVDRDQITFNKMDETAVVSTYDDPLVIIRGLNGNTPDEAVERKLKVRAISENLREGDFSNVLTFSDEIQPDVTSANYTSGNDRLTVTFEEPLEKGPAEDPSNYTIEDTNGNQVNVTIENISYEAYYGSSNATEDYNVVITVANGNNLNTGQTVIVDPAVTDLAGNSMDTNDSNNDNDGKENEATY
ncbi:hypothetical protein [Fodinibius sp. AD559]|uniref:hypothetical protein n=1 Tax=Fodinibius sp. AD559 TaxID=3424179 RepID=UPI004046F012